MKRKPILLVLAVLVFTANPVFGFTGAQLVEKCNASFAENPNSQSSAKVLAMALDSGSCAGFVGGVIHGVNLVGSMLQKQGATTKNFICLPKGLHAKDLVRTTLDHFSSHPSDAKGPAQLGVFNGFMRKYPCKDKK